MKFERQAHETLNSFIHEVGIMHELHSDNAKTLFQGEMAKKIQRFDIYQTFLSLTVNGKISLITRLNKLRILRATFSNGKTLRFDYGPMRLYMLQKSLTASHRLMLLPAVLLFLN